MENSESHIDLKALRAQMRELRRQRSMSVVRFACELDKPAWLIDLMEHADEPAAAPLCDLLPKREIAAVQKAFKQLRSRVYAPNTGTWERRTGFPAEHTFYLPVTVSVDGLMDIMEQMMLFAVDDGRYAVRRQKILCRGVMSVSALAGMLHVQYTQAGDQWKAWHCLRSFRESLQERMRICC